MGGLEEKSCCCPRTTTGLPLNATILNGRRRTSREQLPCVSHWGFPFIPRWGPPVNTPSAPLEQHLRPRIAKQSSAIPGKPARFPATGSYRLLLAQFRQRTSPARYVKALCPVPPNWRVPSQRLSLAETGCYPPLCESIVAKKCPHSIVEQGNVPLIESSPVTVRAGKSL